MIKQGHTPDKLFAVLAELDELDEQFMIELLGTPEAGKTTFKSMLNAGLPKEYKTCALRESAEIVPECFPKKGMHAHFWMRLNTVQKILEAQYSDSKCIVIDRGLVDTLFWDEYYYLTGKLTHECATISNDFFQSMGVRFPDLVVYLYTTPEEAIRRRGGEGRIVTLEFVKTFKESLDEFLKSISVPVFSLDTTGLSKDEVLERVLEQITKVVKKRL